MPFDTTTRAPARNSQGLNTAPGSVSGRLAVLGVEPKTALFPADPQGAALPCQNRNNSAEPVPKLQARLSSGVGKSAFCLQENVKGFCDRFGLDRVGFLTLTFPDHVLCAREASRRFNNLARHVLRDRYPAYVRVLERQKSGRVHFHLLVACSSDIRSGVDFDAFTSGEYRSAPEALRAEWRFWRETAKRYGFGRTELLPVRSTSHAIGRYVGKYIGKHFSSREARDKGVRLVSYSGERVAINRLSWVSPNAKLWRAKKGGFVRMLHRAGAISAPTDAAMAAKFGPKWVHYWRDSIFSFPAESELERAETAPVPCAPSVSLERSDSSRRSRRVPIPPQWAAVFRGLRGRGLELPPVSSVLEPLPYYGHAAFESFFRASGSSS